MAAQKGNRCWEVRAKHGLDKLYNDPHALWEDCCGYFEWIDQNPIYEEKLISYQGEGSTHAVPKRRVMTWIGLALYLGVTGRSLTRWYQERDDLRPVLEAAAEVIKDDKFTGAAAELYNSNIIARDLGLRDSQEHAHTSPDGSMSPRPFSDFYATSDEDEEYSGEKPGDGQDS